jgi:hypothetical protein
MELANDFELQNTKIKLRELIERYQHARTYTDDRIREWTLRSYRNLINQLTEEIARYESRLQTA